MCRKMELLGSVMMALGAGLLLSLLFSSEFVLVVLGIALLVAGLCHCAAAVIGKYCARGPHMIFPEQEGGKTMELVFQEKQLDYLGRVLDQTVTQELTAEVIVPDSCADADRVVDAFGTPLVRAEECAAGSASVSGEVQAGILFVTEDGRLERLGDRDPVQRPARLGGGAERLPPAMRLPPGAAWMHGSCTRASCS